MLAEDRRGERQGKAHEMRQVGTRETYQKARTASRAGLAVEASLRNEVASELRILKPSSGDEPGGDPSTGQAMPGVEAA